MDSLGTLAFIGDPTVCSPTVRTVHQMIGATVELTVDGNLVGGGVATFTNQAFPVKFDQSWMGKKVVAVQKLSGYSDSAKAEKALGGVPTPGDLSKGFFYTPFYVCATCVWVHGLLPGATVDVYVKGEFLGSAQVNEYGGANVNLKRPLEPTDTLNALQTLCGVKSAGPIVAPAPQPMPNALPTPTVDPLLECAQALYVKNVTPGAMVTLRRNKVQSLGTFCAAIPEFPIYPIEPLKPMDEISVAVDFETCGRYRHQTLHGESSTVVLDMPPGAPQILPLCGGQPVIALAGLQTGATVKLTFNGATVVFGAPAATTKYAVGGSGVQDDSSVTAVQSLCAGIWGPSTTRKVPSSTPARPELASPPNNALNVGLTPTLVWKDGKETTPCNHPNQFSLQISKNDATFASPKEFGPIDIHQFTIPKPGLEAKETTYYWRVKANKGAKKSDWSVPFHFKTVMSATSKPNSYDDKPDPHDLPGTWCFIQDCCPVYQRKVVCASGNSYNDVLAKLWAGIKDAPSCWIYLPDVTAKFDCGTCSDPKGP